MFSENDDAISYEEAINILSEMFQELDEHTIQTALHRNGGGLERTIEACLALYDDQSNNKYDQQKKGNYKQYFIDPRAKQEEEDLMFALQLQEQLNMESQQQQEKKNITPNKGNQIKKQKQQKQIHYEQEQKYEKPSQQQYINLEQNDFGGDDNDFQVNKNQMDFKEKKTFSQKVQTMKKNFLSLFKKKKKQQKSDKNANLQEKYVAEDNAEIELLDLNDDFQLNFSDEEPAEQNQIQNKPQQQFNQSNKKKINNNEDHTFHQGKQNYQQKQPNQMQYQSDQSDDDLQLQI